MQQLNVCNGIYISPRREIGGARGLPRHRASTFLLTQGPSCSSSPALCKQKAGGSVCRNLRSPLPPPPHRLEPPQPPASSSGLGEEEAMGSRCWQTAKPHPLLLPFELPHPLWPGLAGALSFLQGTPWPGNHGFSQYLGAEHTPATGLRHLGCSIENKAGNTLLLEQGEASTIAQLRLIEMVPSSLTRR